MEFRDRLLETYSPVVMVVSSPEAEALVQEKNGLTIVDLLRPFGYFHHLSGEGGGLLAGEVTLQLSLQALLRSMQGAEPWHIPCPEC